MPKILLQPFDAAQPTEIGLTRRVHEGKERSHVLVNGNSVEADVEWGLQDQGCLHMKGQSIPFFFHRSDDHVTVWVAGRVFQFRTTARVARRSGADKSALPAGDLTAPMPGTILKINVKAGDAFAAHQPLIIMESMKMEMTLSSPRAGRVREINCRAGELVELGRLLARLEDDDE